MTAIDPTAPIADAPESVRATAPLAGLADMVIRSIMPLFLALVACGILIAALGHNPFSFYLDIWRGGIELTAWQDSLMRAATLAPIALGLIVVFRANIWNLGYQGQFLLSAAMIAGLAPHLERHLSVTLTLIVLFVVGGVTGAVWTLIPAILKAWYETNEIITTLMMTFIGVSLASILIKGPFQDFSSNVPADAADQPRPDAADDPGHPCARRRDHRGGARADRALRDHAHVVRAQAPGARREPARGAARGPRPQARSSSARSCAAARSWAWRRRSRCSASGATCAPTGTRPTATP